MHEFRPLCWLVNAILWVKILPFESGPALFCLPKYFPLHESLALSEEQEERNVFQTRDVSDCD